MMIPYLGLLSLFFTITFSRWVDSVSQPRSRNYQRIATRSPMYLPPPIQNYNLKCPRLRYMLKNGNVKLRNKGRIAKFTCDPDYTLHGKIFATCLRGQWNTPLPICLKSGCPTLDVPINGGYNSLYKGSLIHYWCHPGYTMLGSTSVYCDGEMWNDTITPACKVSIQNPPTMCDFEDIDLCGWVEDNSDDFDWKRHQFATPSGHVGTGPSFDHTSATGLDGYYMYIEASAPRKENDKARLFSPVYSADLSSGCFVMWYHMYGANTGILRIYIRGDEQVLDELNPVWEKRGEQGNQWLRATVDIDALTTDFQIVIEGSVGNGYVGDIAIDDLSLRIMTCDEIRTNEDIGEMNGTCTNRCFEDQIQGGNETCECNAQCDTSLTCCPDYVKICVRGKGGPSSITIEPSSEEIPPTFVPPSEIPILSNITLSNVNTTELTTRIPEIIVPEATTEPATTTTKPTLTSPTAPEPTIIPKPTIITPNSSTTTPKPATTNPKLTTTPKPTPMTPKPTTTEKPMTTTHKPTTSTTKPTTSTTKPTTSTPKPTTTTPKPTTTTPKPTTTTPKPTTTTPKPTTTTPKPTTITPKPTTTTPIPTTTTPIPTTTTPIPTTTTPIPTTTTPIPTTTTPIPSITTPKPTTTTPIPTTITLKPMSTAPKPTSTTPKSTTTSLKPTTPKPTTTSLKPTTPKPATTAKPTTAMPTSTTGKATTITNLTTTTTKPTTTTQKWETTTTTTKDRSKTSIMSTRKPETTKDHDYHYSNYYDPDQYSYDGHEDSKEVFPNGDSVNPIVLDPSHSQENSKGDSSVWGIVVGVLALTIAFTIITIQLIRRSRRNWKRANDELHTRFLSDKEEVYFS